MLTYHRKEDFHRGFSFLNQRIEVWRSGQQQEQMLCRDPRCWTCLVCHRVCPLNLYDSNTTQKWGTRIILTKKYGSLNHWTKIFRMCLVHLRGGVSSDIIMAIGPLKPPHPLASDELMSWKDHHWYLARFITRSPLTEISCKLPAFQ